MSKEHDYVYYIANDEAYNRIYENYDITEENFKTVTTSSPTEKNVKSGRKKFCRFRCYFPAILLVCTFLSLAIVAIMLIFRFKTNNMEDEKGSKNQSIHLRGHFNHACPLNFTLCGEMCQKCYRFVNSYRTMQSADEICKHEFGGRLPEPQNFFEYQELLKERDTPYFYLGAKRQHGKGFFYRDGEIPMKFALWEHGEPNNKDGIEDCVIVVRTTTRGMNDVPCTYRAPFICEVDAIIGGGD